MGPIPTYRRASLSEKLTAAGKRCGADSTRRLPRNHGGIQSGRIAAGALADPFTDHAKKLGYKEIADIAALGLEFPS
jgi:hypothetical protein